MPTWKSYEQVATYLLNQFASEFGLERVEGKQGIVGLRSGTSWEIDAKGIVKGNAGFMVVECRRYTTEKQNQEKIAGLAYRIIDSGAKGGIVVSPLGLQAGAKLVADAENILSAHLNEHSTQYNYILNFLNKVKLGLQRTLCLKGSLMLVVRDKDGNIVSRVERK
jgi:hypothetical protein